jgi:hypothetical protein
MVSRRPTVVWVTAAIAAALPARDDLPASGLEDDLLPAGLEDALLPMVGGLEF